MLTFLTSEFRIYQMQINGFQLLLIDVNGHAQYTNTYHVIRIMISFTPLPLYPRGNSLGTNWVGLMGPTACLHAVKQSNIASRRRVSNPK
jgi:hypothetical protein